jgi:hypothetical protein
MFPETKSRTKSSKTLYYILKGKLEANINPVYSENSEKHFNVSKKGSASG